MLLSILHVWNQEDKDVTGNLYQRNFQGRVQPGI